MIQNDRKNINILVTLNESYIPHLNTMLYSLTRRNPDCYFDIYMLHTSIPESALNDTRRILDGYGTLFPVRADNDLLKSAPTSDRYPKEIYYRLFAAKYLPECLDKILYLDPDIIINGSVKALYDTPLDGHYYAAASHIRSFIHKFNEIRLDMDAENLYINSGVMMMNLKLLRQEQCIEDVLQYIYTYRHQLLLPDQDVISSLYGSKILALDPFRYNMTERMYRLYLPIKKELSLNWIRENSVIIHYCGRNKPWNPNYSGRLNVFYNEIAALM